MPPAEWQCVIGDVGTLSPLAQEMPQLYAARTSTFPMIKPLSGNLGTPYLFSVRFLVFYLPSLVSKCAQAYFPGLQQNFCCQVDGLSSLHCVVKWDYERCCSEYYKIEVNMIAIGWNSPKIPISSNEAFCFFMTTNGKMKRISWA